MYFLQCLDRAECSMLQSVLSYIETGVIKDDQFEDVMDKVRVIRSKFEDIKTLWGAI